MAVSEEECSFANSRSSSSSTSSSSHYLSTCLLCGTVVLQVLYGHIHFPDSRDIVFGKEKSIELVIIGEDGIVQFVCKRLCLAPLKTLPSYLGMTDSMLGKDLLVLFRIPGSSRFYLSATKCTGFFPVTQIQLSNPGNSRNQLARMLANDSRRREEAQALLKESFESLEDTGASLMLK